MCGGAGGGLTEGEGDGTQRDIIPKHHQTRRIYDWVDRAAHTGGVGAVVDRVVGTEDSLASCITLHHRSSWIITSKFPCTCCMYWRCLTTYSSISLRLVKAGGASPFDTRDPMLIYRQILLYVEL